VNKSEIQRIFSIIRNTISILKIDLSGLNILTEAGSGYFIFTPLIASLAGANHIYVWTKDSDYGSAVAIQNEFNTILKLMNLEDNFSWALNERPANHINQADIITNLGFVRPLNREFISEIKNPDAAISLMCESWELRKTDIDLGACIKNKIKVAGTWENYPLLKIFDACGPLAIKMANEAGYEVYQNNIIIWSDDQFGDVIQKSFLNHGATRVVKTTDLTTLKNSAADTDFLFICQQRETNPFFGENGIIDLGILFSENPHLGIVHLYGDIDNEMVKSCGFSVFPDRKGKAQIMSYTLAHLGPIPVINLHAAGLKVGECTFRNNFHPIVQPVLT
jgi:hypothetical protein